MEKPISLVEARVITSRVDLIPGKNKNGYDNSFKTLFDSRSQTRLGSQVGLIIDPGQHKNKNGYYHSFKTQLEN